MKQSRDPMAELRTLVTMTVALFTAVVTNYVWPNTDETKPMVDIQESKPVKMETVHYVTLKFTQSSFTLSIRQHIKDSANAFSFTFPTTKQFYDSVKEGQEISSKFKTASFLLSGNIGSRKVVVEKKFTKQEPIK